MTKFPRPYERSAYKFPQTSVRLCDFKAGGLGRRQRRAKGTPGAARLAGERLSERCDQEARGKDSRPILEGTMRGAALGTPSSWPLPTGGRDGGKATRTAGQTFDLVTALQTAQLLFFLCVPAAHWRPKAARYSRGCAPAVPASCLT